MSNLFDYLEWRGDLRFEASPFNEIDNIIFAMSTFADLTDIVASDPDGIPVDFPVAMKTLDSMPEERNYLGAIIPAKMLDVARKASATERFGKVSLVGFVNDVDEKKQMQFSAMTFILPDESLYVAFRGTDDTLVGWKEDLMLGFRTPIPAHLQAVEYLSRVAEALPGEIRLGGHSKGGNVAMWAAAYSPDAVKKRITHIYNNDGPGFLPEIVSAEEYLSVADRIVTYVPQSSIVGVLLEPSPTHYIIKSTQSGILQHDPLSWEVLGTSFVRLDARSKFGQQSDQTIRNWVYSMSEEDRGKFAEILFSLIDSTGAKTLTDLSTGKIKNLSAFMKTLHGLDKDSRVMMSHTLRRLLSGK